MWKESYCMGNEIIDAQHKRLFDTMDRIMTYVMDDGKWEEHYEECLDGFAYLRPAAMEHFQAEEDYMRSIYYGGLERHVALHREFLSDLKDYEYSLKVSQDKREIVKKFIGFLLMWLLNHVAGEDQKFLKSNPVVYENPKEEKTWAKSLVTGVSITMMKLFQLKSSDLSGRPIIGNEKTADVFVNIDIFGDFNGSIEYGFSQSVITKAISNVTLIKLDERDTVIQSALAGISRIINVLAIQYLEKNGLECVAGAPQFLGEERTILDDEAKIKILIQSPLGDVTVITNIAT